MDKLAITLTTMDDVFAQAGISISELNTFIDGDGMYVRVLGVARAVEGHDNHLDLDKETWAIGAVLKDAEGKALGIGDSRIGLHKSPVEAFKIAIYTLSRDIGEYAEIELYPFVDLRSF